ncbi:MAG TPA: BamA/TamA family outer membrane protein [Bacteroidia bacterium]
MFSKKSNIASSKIHSDLQTGFQTGHCFIAQNSKKNKHFQIQSAGNTLLRLFCLVTIFYLNISLNAQDTTSNLKVLSINISGNKITKSQIIKRELTFTEGDTIKNWDHHMNRSRQQLLNLFLFNQVTITMDSGIVMVDVKERWYYWPIPELDYADRNFNQWWLSKDLKRLIYGVNFMAYNLRGRNETMTLSLISGYTKQAGVSYKVPYFNKKHTWGLQVAAAYSSNREVWFKTADDKVKFFRDNDQELIHQFKSEISFTNRPAFYSYHQPYIGLRYTSVKDTVLSAQVNPQFLLDSVNKQMEAYIGYQFTFDKRDFKGYPMNGWLLKANAEVGRFMSHSVLSTAALRLSVSQYKQLSKKWFAAANFTGRIYSNSQPQYTRVQALGYGKDYIRGYELKVIDGNHFALAKLEIKYKLFDHTLPFFKTLKGYEQLPVTVFLTAFSDAAYVNNNDKKMAELNRNLLPNSFQQGKGIGVNVVMYYDYVARLEYSFDKQMKARFYLSFVASM